MGDSVCTKRGTGTCIVLFLFRLLVFKGPFAFVNVQTSSSFFYQNSIFIRVCRFSLCLLPFGTFGSGAGKYGIRVRCFCGSLFILFEMAFLSKVGEEIGGIRLEWYRLNRKKISEIFVVL